MLYTSMYKYYFSDLLSIIIATPDSDVVEPQPQPRLSGKC